MECQEYLDITKFKNAEFDSEQFELYIQPFEYLDGRKPRLPRKSSKRYQIRADTKFYFQSVFEKIEAQVSYSEFAVEILVFSGLDRLGNADLDNYCKAILDGITTTQKVWKDDKQVDEVKLKRVYTKDPQSYIQLKIKRIDRTCK